MLSGVEIEYAGWTQHASPRGAAERLLAEIVCASGAAPAQVGVFLPNGARALVDNAHLELSTPETSAGPGELVRYLFASHAIIQSAAERCGASVGLTQIDYTMSATFGFHENYHVRSATMVAQAITPFLAARVALCGPGGLNPAAPGIEFTLSPRTMVRAATMLADWPATWRAAHADRGERLHLTCGEALTSAHAERIRAGMTGLVVALADQGIPLPSDLPARRVPAAAKKYATQFCDPARNSERRAMPMPDAYQVLSRHFELAAEYSSAHFMPPWTKSFLPVWAEALEDLRIGPKRMARRYDWATKYAIFSDLIRARGFTWDSLRAVNEMLVAMRRDGPRGRMIFPPDDPNGQVLRERLSCAQVRELETCGLSVEQVADSMRLRAELCELDVKFGILGADGIATKLSSAGLVQYDPPRTIELERATREPPAVSRAAARGELVRKLCDANIPALVDWHRVTLPASNVAINFPDPRTLEANRAPLGGDESQLALDAWGSLLACQLRWANYTGWIARGREIWAKAQPFLKRISPRVREDLIRFAAFNEARGGDGASILWPLARCEPKSMRDITDWMNIHRFSGLRPRPQLARLIERGKAALRTEPERQPCYRVIYAEYSAAHHLSVGNLETARTLLAGALIDERRHDREARILARLLALLGEVHRRQGRSAKARSCLDRAYEIQSSWRLRGDLSDLTLPSLAKLEPDRARAMEYLEEAQSHQQSQENDQGLARTTVLMARIGSDDPSLAKRCRDEVDELWRRTFALRGCPLMNLILARWDDWSSGASCSDLQTDDPFWGV
jgi:hypothetical protein